MYCKLLIDPIWVMGLPLDPYALGAVTRWMEMKADKAKKKKKIVQSSKCILPFS